MTAVEPRARLGFVFPGDSWSAGLVEIVKANPRTFRLRSVKIENGIVIRSPHLWHRLVPHDRVVTVEELDRFEQGGDSSLVWESTLLARDYA